MPLAVNLVYLALFFLFAPILAFRSFRSARFREGWSENFSGQGGPRRHRRPAVCLDSCR